MADDPYDFEIAIPSGGGNAAKAKLMGYGQSSRRYGGGSSDGESSEGASISASDDGTDDGDDSIESLDVKTESKQRSAANAKSTNATRVPASSASGSSALDKAKNFLSKYSTKTVESSKAKQPTSSARLRRQIELSMDDSMDFSPDDDEESEEPPKRSKQQPKASTSTTKARRSDSSDDSDGQVAREKTPAAAVNTKTDKPAAKAPSLASDDLEESRDHGGYGTTPATMAPAGHPRNGNAGGYSSTGSDVDDDDAIASFMDESDDHDPPPFSDAPSRQVSATVTAPLSTTASAPNPPISQLSKPKYGEVDSNGEESIASKSDYVNSFEDEEDVATSNTKTRQITAAAAKQLNASESGVYAEEDFDEESETMPSTAIAATPAKNTSQPAKQDALTKAEPNFDYSMDFSEDTVVDAKTGDSKSVMHTVAVPDNQAQEARERRSPSASSSSSRSGASREDEHSDFLENSNESGDVVAADETSHAMDDSKTGLGPAKGMTLETEEQYLHHANKLPAPVSTPANLDEYSPFSSLQTMTKLNVQMRSTYNHQCRPCQLLHFPMLQYRRQESPKEHH
uniref:Uncharacterized protein n=1 Tax=Globisporangium ultimum (strain ATCC 200006 / CBS 805.95 / DAOM BR144) TaxID=431595 RepID=K3X1F9_GLOUD